MLNLFRKNIQVNNVHEVYYDGNEYRYTENFFNRNTQAKMKILVCGSRTYNNCNPKLQKVLDSISVTEGDTIISGGARGADHYAEEYAKVRKCHLKVFNADWDKYGKRAGYIRNAEMIDQKPDIVIAFWDGISKGTKNTISLAKNKKIPILIIWIKND